MFESAKLKVERANQHINTLHQGLTEFFKTRPCRIISDFDPDERIFRLRVETTSDFPLSLGIIIGDVVHNLRSALEHVASDLYVLANGGDEEARKRSKFPMHKTRENLIDMIDKGEIKPALPNVAKAIVDTVKPFETGSKFLWALGQLWNIDKHRLPIVTFAAARIMGFAAHDQRGNIVSGGGATVTVGGFLNYMGTDTLMTITDEGETSFAVFFNEIGLLEGEPLVPTLVQMSQLTGKAIEVIAEAATTNSPP